MILHDTPFLTIHWLDKVPCILMEWKKFIKGKGYRDGLDKGLELVVEREASLWLADLRKLQVIDIADQDWTNSDWFPRAIAGGITCMAIVVPEDVFAKMSVSSIMKKVEEDGLAVKYFDDKESAQNWLIENRS